MTQVDATEKKIKHTRKQINKVHDKIEAKREFRPKTQVQSGSKKTTVSSQLKSYDDASYKRKTAAQPNRLSGETTDRMSILEEYIDDPILNRNR